MIIPAIDLRGGNVVRLFQGDYGQEKNYALDPVDVAQKFEFDGARMIHVVDLDGAKDGVSKNYEIISKIIKAVDIPIECGGGLRTKESVSRILGLGVKRAVIGTKALDGMFLSDLAQTFGSDSIVVGIDASNGKVKTEGWLEDSGISVDLMCKRVIDCGVKHVIYTDIACDGTLKGPNYDGLKKVLSFNDLQVVASGGIGSLEHIEKIKELNAFNLFGIIVGKAIYEGTVSLLDATKLYDSAGKCN